MLRGLNATAQVPLQPSSELPMATSPSGRTATASRNARRRRRRRRGGQPDSDGDSGERAESEALTRDAIVTLSDAHPPRQDLPVPGPDLEGPLLHAPPGVHVMRDPGLPGGQAVLRYGAAVSLATSRKGSSSSVSWTSNLRLKWRGGAVPIPPKWSYEKYDLRAFSKFGRKVRLWQLQVAFYMSTYEAALTLYSSLTGEPEAELAQAPLNKIDDPNGVEYILEQLRTPRAQKLVVQKRRYLAECEAIFRCPGEQLGSSLIDAGGLRGTLLQLGSTSWACVMEDLEATIFWNALGSDLLIRSWLVPAIH